MANGISIDDYLKYLEQPSATNLGTPAKVAPDADWTTSPIFGQPEVDKVVSDNAALDFLGSLVWGGVSGLTWGASEFVAKSKPWEEMSDTERAGWATGEGLSLFTPFVGPFALIGKGGQVATKALRGNNFIRKAASELVKKEGLLANQIVDEAVERGVMPQLVARDLKKQFS